MQTDLLYLKDSYQKEGKGTAKFFEFTDLVVDKSIFYPTGYGQPNDRGKVIIDGKEYLIVDTWNDGTDVHLMSHDTFPDGTKGKEVHQIIDWDVRYAHMKFRTALKIITGIVYQKYGATTRINQTYDDQAWVDIEMNEDLTEAMVKELQEEANYFVQKNLDVTFYDLPRTKFTQDKELMKICKGRVPDFDTIRIMKIEGLPDQEEFGTDVHKTGEIGKIEFKTTMVKGKISKRLNVFLS
ncbi:alanyl-tRNA editing protein [Oxyplasma meridianum]|uniref:Alanyl-tRNA editing protein n=1 Tax=Oxyplasma meridianum TaxID=3073602 RepID=A0AAX4NG17_9ARCH